MPSSTRSEERKRAARPAGAAGTAGTREHTGAAGAQGPKAQAGPAGVHPARRPVRAQGPCPAAAVQPGSRRASSASGSRAALIALGILLLFGFGAGYAFFWRSVQVTVNGEGASARIGTPLDRFLEDNGYFGATPGRLLSIGGNVISEDGGTRATVTFDGRSVSADELGSERLADGSSIEVGPGVDAEEAHTEETVEVAPQIEKQAGSAIQFVSQWGRTGKKTVWTGEVSGEKVDREVVEPAQNMVVSSLNVRPEGDGKYIALTFDDGPSGYTQRILDILKERGAKATFFNLGSHLRIAFGGFQPTRRGSSTSSRRGGPRRPSSTWGPRSPVDRRSPRRCSRAATSSRAIPTST